MPGTVDAGGAGGSPKELPPRARLSFFPSLSPLRELYGDVVGRFVQNASSTSNFALSAQLASAWWLDEYGETPDFVVSIDPFVLEALVAATGPVILPDGTSLDADDLVTRLLVEPYLQLDPAGQTRREPPEHVAEPARRGDGLRVVGWTATALAGRHSKSKSASPSQD